LILQIDVTDKWIRPLILHKPITYKAHGVSGENITERAKGLSFLRPIRDGEHYVGKRPSEFIFQSLPKIYGGPAGVIAECPAAPGAENKRLMPVSARNIQHAMNSLL
jgi:hypothetical protein